MITSPRLVRAAIRLARIVPIPLLRGLAMGTGMLGYALLGRRRRTILSTMRRLRPADSRASQRRLARRLFRNMASAVVDLVRLPTATREEMLALVTPIGLEHVDAAIAMGKGLVLVSGHFGPYELAAAWMGARGYQLDAIAEELDPEVMEALAAFRTVTGMRLLPLRSAVTASQAVLAQRGILAIAADRVIGVSRSALDLPWGAGVRPIPIGAATFAIDSGAPIVIAHITRYHRAPTRYLVEFDAPMVAPATLGREALTRRISDRLADIAIAHPDEWFVFQPGWRSGVGAGVAP